MRICFINIALPGAGKSTLTQKLVDYYRSLCYTVYVCSADDYFKGNAVGEYRYDRNKISKAHFSCKEKFNIGLNDKSEKLVVIVDNTNVKWNDSEYYRKTALANNFELRFLEPDTSWKYDIQECFNRNTHNVPLFIMKNMWQALINTLKEINENGYDRRCGFTNGILQKSERRRD